VALIDGNRAPKDFPCPTHCVVKGDSKSLSIAAASILAKVTRDRLMLDLDAQFPVYGWARNMGYGTAEHRAAVAEHGPTDHHRRSFARQGDLFG
jgi:ribonuclease HII